MSKPNGAGLIADRYLYVTRNNATLVEQGAPDAVAYLLAGPGVLIPADAVEQLGLHVVDGRVEQKSAEAPKRPAPTPPPDSGDTFPKAPKRKP